MRTSRFFLLIFSFSCFISQAYSQDTIRWYSIDEIEKIWKQNPKKLLFFSDRIIPDSYAAKSKKGGLSRYQFGSRLEKQVFQKPEIVRLIKQNFYAVHFDMLRKEPITFFGKTYKYFPDFIDVICQNNGRRMWPAFAIYDQNFSFIHTLYRKNPREEGMLQLLSYVLQEHYKEMKYEVYDKLISSHGVSWVAITKQEYFLESPDSSFHSAKVLRNGKNHYSDGQRIVPEVNESESGPQNFLNQALIPPFLLKQLNALDPATRKIMPLSETQKRFRSGASFSASGKSTDPLTSDEIKSGLRSIRSFVIEELWYINKWDKSLNVYPMRITPVINTKKEGITQRELFYTIEIPVDLPNILQSDSSKINSTTTSYRHQASNTIWAAKTSSSIIFDNAQVFKGETRDAFEEIFWKAPEAGIVNLYTDPLGKQVAGADYFKKIQAGSLGKPLSFSDIKGFYVHHYWSLSEKGFEGFLDALSPIANIGSNEKPELKRTFYRKF